ncbi:PilN domain-containing protein [Arenimonas oryziterrae]|uniref:GspL cytoplasmic actin-ATPase-like domain-containing protein n=1 Tax=Arenimonas oryziterrae DSM 21050 = YC6267 TaxID=1121015 RepID=A0A091AUR1_9GAMM|nr:PilN domain-containing protein [Arenimonas oryziterrae]KFN43186.1 hypothetical protein N789_11530 [Arenimonas oryziterrae DSM 21050 = YC6267]
MPADHAFFQALEPLRLRYLDSPIPGWWRMAGEAVLGLLPARLRQQLGAQQRLLLLQLSDNELRLHASLDGSLQTIGSVPLDDAELLTNLRLRLDDNAGGVPRWLLIDPSQALRRSLSLPASAETRLRDVLMHEIDRQTPFAADQVSFEARVLSRDAVSKLVRVELVVLPKARLDAALAALGPMAQGLAGVDVREPDGQRLGVNLLPATQRGAGVDRALRINLVLALVLTTSLFAAMWLALANRQATLDAYTTQLATANQQAREVRKLRHALDASVQAANFLAKQRAQQPTMLELVADLTKRMPDDTYLEKVSVIAGRVTVVGESSQASALVGMLQSSPVLRSPGLVGPVQADPRTKKERFTLMATVAGSAQEAEDGKAR